VEIHSALSAPFAVKKIIGCELSSPITPPTNTTMKKHLTLALTLLTLICSSAQAQLPSYLPADGLVGWWPFNGNANDESGNGNDGDIQNGLLFTSDRNNISNSALDFDGNDDQVVINHSSSLSPINFVTAGFWVNPSFYEDGKTILEKGSHVNLFQRSYGFYGPQNNGKISFFVSSGNTELAVSSISNIELNQWTYIVGVFNGSSIKIYVNGTLEAEQLLFGNINQNTEPLLFGSQRYYAFSDYWFNGLIDDIAIYNRALTEQEIQNLYAGTSPAACLDLPANLQDGLVGYWPFCGNANDESGNGNNGTVNGATLAEDRFGNAGSAYSFDGVDDYITANASTALDASSYSEITLSAWVNTAEFSPTGSASKIITHTSIDDPNVQQYALSVQHDSALYFLAGTGQFEANGINVSSPVLFTNQWQHVIMTYDGESVSFYVNGILVFTKLENDNFPTSPTGAMVFSSIQSSQYNRLYNGLLDDITIYNRALSPEEITQLYAVQSTGDPTAGGGNVTTGPLSNVPRGISYQAVARDAQGQAIVSSPVNVRFTLHQGTPTGTTEYSETHALTTNEIGLFHTFFGAGTAITSAFDSIVWSNTTKFLQVEIDLGNGYVDMGTQQLMSVPYAYRANEAAAAGTIRNAALPIYPDNAAALAGGLVAGEMYRTAGGDLKIVF
jgi:hypothetical protein